MISARGTGFSEARGRGLGTGGRVMQSCAFLCVPGAKLFFGQTKPIFDNTSGIIGFEAIFRGVGGEWWHATAGRRESAVEREMPMADAVESRWGEVSGLGSARVGAGLDISLVLDRSERRLARGDLPARCEDSTGSQGIRLTD